MYWLLSTTKSSRRRKALNIPRCPYAHGACWRPGPLESQCQALRHACLQNAVTHGPKQGPEGASTGAKVAARPRHKGVAQGATVLNWVAIFVVRFQWPAHQAPLGVKAKTAWCLAPGP
jgi:hypothetical protein